MKSPVIGRLAAAWLAVLWAGCAPEPEPTIDEEDSRASSQGGATHPGEQEPFRDSDGDGVRDERDRCHTPRLEQSDGQGELRRHVSPADGCPEVSLPRVCHGDSAPPRMVLGLHPSFFFVNGATVRMTKLDGHKVISLRMNDYQDADLLEDCPDLATYMSAVVRIGPHYRSWVCEGRESKAVMALNDGPHVVRQILIDDGNPCLFDPTLVGIGDAEVSAALASGDIQVVLLFHARDGAGNTLTTNLGDGTLDSAACGFTTLRTGHNQLASVTPISCPGSCPTAPTAVLGPNQVIMPPIPPGLTDPTIVLADPLVRVVQTVTVGVGPSCAPPVVSAQATSLRVGEELLVDPDGGAPLACSTAPGPGAAQFTITCAVQPAHVTFTPGGDAVVAHIQILVATNGQIKSLATDIVKPL
jgi:hypothetical protein